MAHEDLKSAIEQAYKRKFISKDKFAEEIENYVLKTGLNYIDAIVEYCAEKEIEVESVNKLIPKALKEKIRAEALKLNYLRKSSKASEIKFN